MVLLLMIYDSPIAKFSLKLKTKPISTNNAYYRKNGSFTKDARRWRYNFMKEIMHGSNQSQIKEIKKIFDKKLHHLKVTYTWHQPKDKLFTKNGHISLQSFDVDNCIKIPQDCLFDKRYNNTWLKKRSKNEQAIYKGLTTLNNLQLGDQFITSVTSNKTVSPTNNYELIISIEVHEL